MRTNLLRKSLRLNALITSLFILLLLAFNQPLAELMGGFPAVYLNYLAYSLMAFVVLVLYVSEQNPLPLRLATLIAYLDEAWVLGSILLMIFASSSFSMTGMVFIGLTAVVVAILAYYEARGIKQLKTESVSTT